MRYAEVTVNSPASKRQTFSYSIPPGLTIEIGQAVYVPFGQKTVQGIVLELTAVPAFQPTRDIIGIIDQKPLLSAEQIRLAKWLSDYYLSPLFDAVALMLPPGFERRVLTSISLARQEYDTAALSERQQNLLEILKLKGTISLRDLEKSSGKKRTSIIVSQLVELGLIDRTYELEKIKVLAKQIPYIRPSLALAQAQQEAFKILEQKSPKVINFLRFLSLQSEPIPLSEVKEKTGYTRRKVNSLARKGLVSIEDVSVSGIPRLVPYLRLLNTENPAQTKTFSLINKKSPQQAKLFEFLVAQTEPISLEEIKPRIKTRQQTADALAKRGLIEIQYIKSPSKPKQVPHIRVLIKSDKLQEEIVQRLDKAISRQLELLKLLSEEKQARPFTELKQKYHELSGNFTALIRNGWVIKENVEVRRAPLSHYNIQTSLPLSLSLSQKIVFQSIMSSLHDTKRPAAFLLHGVTASGKTEIYLRALAEAIRLGKRGIALVPEIALTPQTIERFSSRFPGRVAVLHSQLSLGEQYDEWQRIRNGEVDVVVGPRSALFAPQPNLGLIIIDEEHEWTYKQHEQSPRYHVRDVAIKLAELTGVVVIMGSATPSVETYYHAQKGNYQLLQLPERVVPKENAPLPSVEIVDMRKELRTGNRSIFSQALTNAIEKVLTNKQQAILFLNRRGSATTIQCRNCGFVIKCKRCDISLTYHFDSDSLVCHRCNYRTRPPQICPNCRSRRIRYLGTGTEKLETEVKALFPLARVMRWDSDVTQKKHSHEDILNKFRNYEADILIGTQMVAKGLDLPMVTLVGVVIADTALNLPDFRAGERTFQLLSQVAGRAGRGASGGEVIIQTYNPSHYAIQAAATHDYKAFYEQEIIFRRQLREPPFTQLASLVYTHTNDNRCREEAEKMAKRIIEKRDAEGIPDLNIVGPAPAFIHRLRGRYHWQIILRGSNLSGFLTGILFPQGWVIDIDPVGL